MNNDLGVKVIAVVDLSRMRIYEAKGIKILKQVEELTLSAHKNHRHEKGSFHKSSSSSAFEPHTSTKDLEHHNAAKAVADYLEKLFSTNHNYKELLIAAEPKTMGHIRGQLNNNLKKLVTKELLKDFAHHDMQTIEHAFFS
ncbi:MAG: host attachment protein [Janthinobacterium lividum]